VEVLRFGELLLLDFFVKPPVNSLPARAAPATAPAAAPLATAVIAPVTASVAFVNNPLAVGDRFERVELFFVVEALPFAGEVFFAVEDLPFAVEVFFAGAVLALAVEIFFVPVDLAFVAVEVLAFAVEAFFPLLVDFDFVLVFAGIFYLIPNNCDLEITLARFPSVYWFDTSYHESADCKGYAKAWLRSGYTGKDLSSISRWTRPFPGC
jgi:hypothetical protein